MLLLHDGWWTEEPTAHLTKLSHLFKSTIDRGVGRANQKGQLERLYHCREKQNEDSSLTGSTKVSYAFIRHLSRKYKRVKFRKSSILSLGYHIRDHFGKVCRTKT